MISLYIKFLDRLYLGLIRNSILRINISEVLAKFKKINGSKGDMFENEAWGRLEPACSPIFYPEVHPLNNWIILYRSKCNLYSCDLIFFLLSNFFKIIT